MELFIMFISGVLSGLAGAWRTVTTEGLYNLYINTWIKMHSEGPDDIRHIFIKQSLRNPF